MIESIEGSSSKDLVVPVVNAIHSAIDEDADVINLSLTAIHTTALENAIERAHKEGVVVVAAAGNSGATGNREYPAAYENVIAVAGIGPDGGQSNRPVCAIMSTSPHREPRSTVLLPAEAGSAAARKAAPASPLPTYRRRPHC